MHLIGHLSGTIITDAADLEKRMVQVARACNLTVVSRASTSSSLMGRLACWSCPNPTSQRTRTRNTGSCMLMFFAVALCSTLTCVQCIWSAT